MQQTVIACTSPCAFSGVGVAAFMGETKAAELRPDASGSRHRAQSTEKGSGNSEAPAPDEDMRERRGSHGRRRYALK